MCISTKIVCFELGFIGFIHDHDARESRSTA